MCLATCRYTTLDCTLRAEMMLRCKYACAFIWRIAEAMWTWPWQLSSAIVHLVQKPNGDDLTTVELVVVGQLSPLVMWVPSFSEEQGHPTEINCVQHISQFCRENRAPKPKRSRGKTNLFCLRERLIQRSRNFLRAQAALQLNYP